MDGQRELCTFPLAPNHKMKLSAAGFLTIQDLKGIEPAQLGKDTGLSLEDSEGVLNTVNVADKMHWKSGARCGLSALDLLQEEQSLPGIITFSEKVDQMLGVGVQLCKVTELCGEPGVGKTQFCLQLAVDIQIPTVFGGLHGEAVYIDTEGSFITERLADIIAATIRHCEHIAQMEPNEELLEHLKSLTMQHMLTGIHYYRCYNYVQLLAIVHLLPAFLKNHPKVKLVIIDSLAAPFHHDFEDFSLRTRILTSMAQSLVKMAAEFKISVVLTNKMTTKLNSSGDNGAHLVPALGESWGHACTIRVNLHWEGDQRRAWLCKSPSQAETTVPYQITTGGIRDIIMEERNQAQNAEDETPVKQQKLS
ncbi:hypothetical protein CHS0354_025132 [Potamilus streckersoni]|uniref:DNA repair protein RAD51 homolog 3 n=1 Tax=Potamilus streckersoni TaxID=2493646 RepID=A0AAE0RW68_9BIVA|nr:hypothetical protein CHS0354_025132 [Potamilus streckersoni]